MLGKRSYCIESHPFMNSRTNYVSWLTACAKSCKSITTTQVKVTVNEDLVYFACSTSLETQDNMTFPFHNSIFVIHNLHSRVLQSALPCPTFMFLK